MRKHLLTTTAAAVAAGALTLAAPPASYAADWIDSGAIGTVNEEATSLDVVSTGPGDALAAWTDAGRAYAARAVDGDWQSPVPLSPLGQVASDVHVAANEHGAAVVTWEHPGGGPDLLVLSGRRFAGGTWGSTTNLVPTPSDATLLHDVAIDDDGDAVVGYRIANGADSTALVSDWPAQGSVTSSPIEPGSDDEFLPTLASNADGDVLVTFTRLATIYSTYRPAGSSSWTAAAPVIGNSPNGISTAALRPDGSGVVAGIQNGSEDAVRAVEIGSTGTPGAVSIVSDTAIPANNPSITANADGDILIVWATDGVEGYGIDYSLSTAGGAFTDPTVLAAPITPSGLRPVAALTDSDLRVVVASEANALRVWHRTSGFQAQWQMHTAGPAPFSNPYAVDYDSEGNVVVVGAGADVVHAEFLDAAGPVSRVVKPARSIVTTDQLKLGWVSTDSLSDTTGITDVYATTAAWNAGSHTDPALVVDNATGTQVDYEAVPGTTYCFQVRTQDTVGNAANSQPRCATVPLDDRKLAGKGWTRAEGAGHFLGTVTSTTKEGRTLTRKGVQAKRLALVVQKTLSSGSVRVTFGGKVLGTFSLKGKGKHRVINLATFSEVKSGTLKITVTSKGKPVSIDGLAVVK